MRAEIRIPLFPKRAFGGSAMSYNNTRLNFKKIPVNQFSWVEQEKLIKFVKRKSPDFRFVSGRSSPTNKEN